MRVNRQKDMEWRFRDASLYDRAGIARYFARGGTLVDVVSGQADFYLDFDAGVAFARDGSPAFYWDGGDWLIAHSDGRGAFYLGDPVPHKEINDA